MCALLFYYAKYPPPCNIHKNNPSALYMDFTVLEHGMIIAKKHLVAFSVTKSKGTLDTDNREICSFLDVVWVCISVTRSTWLFG